MAENTVNSDTDDQSAACTSSVVVTVGIYKQTSTLGAGVGKKGISFADGHGHSLAKSVYIDRLYYATSSRYLARLEAQQANQPQQTPDGCCTIS